MLCTLELWATTTLPSLNCLHQLQQREMLNLVSSRHRLYQFFLPAWDLPPMCLPPCSSVHPTPRQITVSSMITHSKWRPMSQKNKLQRHPFAQDPHPTSTPTPTLTPTPSLQQKTEASFFRWIQFLHGDKWGWATCLVVIDTVCLEQATTTPMLNSSPQIGTVLGSLSDRFLRQTYVILQVVVSLWRWSVLGERINSSRFWEEMPIVMGSLGNPKGTFRCHTVGFSKLVWDNKKPSIQAWIPAFVPCAMLWTSLASSNLYNLDWFPLSRRWPFSPKSLEELSVVLLLSVSELVPTETWLQSPHSSHYITPIIHIVNSQLACLAVASVQVNPWEGISESAISLLFRDHIWHSSIPFEPLGIISCFLQLIICCLSSKLLMLISSFSSF